MQSFHLGVVALFIALPAQAQGAEADIAGVLDTVFGPWASTTTPGCAAAVSNRGAVVSRAYGMADLGYGIANTVNTRFEAGSVSKQFVAAAILLLVEDGKLNLADDVRKYLPEMPDYSAVITIDHLLDHTSGLRDWGFGMEIAGWTRSTRAYTNDDALAFAARQRELNHAPGEDYSYTNTGYVLLAMIAERVSGQSLPAFTKTRLFDPLGMTSTGWRVNFRHIEPMMATAYIEVPNGNVEKRPFESAYGDAGLITTVGDLLIWNDALSSGKLGSFVGKAMEQNARLKNGRMLTYARGLTVIHDAQAPEISHGGAMGGYRAWLARFPKQDLSIAVLCNAGEAEGAGVGRGIQLGRKVADSLLPPPSTGEGEMRTGAPVRYAGLFVSEKTGVPLRITHDAKGLQFENGGRLQAYSATHYRVPGSEIVFENENRFRRDRTGDGTTDSYLRVPQPEREAINLDELVGAYTSEELGVTYRVENMPGGLRLRLSDRPAYILNPTPAYRDAWVYDTRMGKQTAIIRFKRDQAGRVSSLTMGWNTRVRAVNFSRH